MSQPAATVGGVPDGPDPLRNIRAWSVAKIYLVIVAMSLLIAAAYLVIHILILGLVAFFFAIGLDPLVRFLGRIGLPRPAAVAAVFVGVILVIAGFVASISPPLVRQTQRLAEQVPTFAQRLSESSEQFAELDERYDIAQRLRGFISDLPNVAARSAGNVFDLLREVGGAIFNVLLVLVLTIYFLLDLPQLVDGALRLLPSSRRERADGISGVFFKRISGYMLGQLGVSTVAGITAMIALAIIRVPEWLPLSIWVGFSAVIPMIGASLGAIPAVIVAFFASPVQGFVTLAFFLAYQQVENYVIHPRVMRQAVDISAPAVLLSALIGASLLGLVGALLAIPVAASLKALTQELWLPRQEAV